MAARIKPCGHPPGWDRAGGCFDCRLDRIVAEAVERTQRAIEQALQRRFPALASTKE